MKTAVIAGATGLTGSFILWYLLDDESYQTIHILGRSLPSTDSPRVVYHYTNFESLDNIQINQPIDEVYCALGTTIKKAGSQDAFKAVDFDAVVTLAEWAKKREAGRFVVVSSIGANAESGSFYLRTKGQMEKRLITTQLNSLIIVRPSLLIGKRNEFRFGEIISEIMLFIIKPFLIGRLKKYRPIKSAVVARAMIELAKSKFGDTYIIQSDELQIIGTKNP